MSLPPGIPPGTDVWAVAGGMPPPGVESDFVNPPTNKAIPQVTLSILLIVATIFVGLRVYVQVFVTRSGLKSDDACVLAALPMQIAYTGVIIWMTEEGLLARHIWDIPLGVLLFRLPRWQRVINSLPQPITGLVKSALLFLYLRIFGVKPRIRILAIFGLVFVALSYTGFTILFALPQLIEQGKIVPAALVQASFNIVTDVFLFVLPLFGILDLQIPTSRKVLITGVFSTGLAAVVMSCLTLYWRDTLPKGRNQDGSWIGATVFTISLVEIDIGIIVACMPVLAPLLPKLNMMARGLSSFVRSQILRTSHKSQSTDTDMSHSRYNYMSDRDPSQESANYYELSEPRQKVPKSSKSSKKHWFDRSVMAISDIAPEDRDNAVSKEGAGRDTVA